MPWTSSNLKHPFGRSGGSADWLALCVGLSGFGAAQAQDAATLKARHAELTDRLAKNAFGRPLALESAQTSNDLKGDIFSVVDYPYATVEQAVKPAGNWCDILILHLNVKGCKATNRRRWHDALCRGRTQVRPADRGRLQARVRLQAGEVVTRLPAGGAECRRRAVRYPQLPDPAAGDADRCAPHVHPHVVCLRLRHGGEDGDPGLPRQRSAAIRSASPPPSAAPTASRSTSAA